MASILDPQVDGGGAYLLDAQESSTDMGLVYGIPAAAAADGVTASVGTSVAIATTAADAAAVGVTASIGNASSGATINTATSNATAAGATATVTTVNGDVTVSATPGNATASGVLASLGIFAAANITCLVGNASANGARAGGSMLRVSGAMPTGWRPHRTGRVSTNHRPVRQ